MNSRRLARLMSIICEIKAHPGRNPDEMCSRFQISRRQFYKDREELKRMGFRFHFSRGKSGFTLDKELYFQAGSMSLADLFALILAVKELTRLNDFGLAMSALAGLRHLVRQLPEPWREQFSEALEELVIVDGFGCPPQVLADLDAAVNDRRRVVLVLDSGPAPQKLTVNPKRLILREGSLFLEVEGLESGASSLVAMHRISKVISMPLFPQVAD
jgi:predicted DNA-binding transcriptional regulator YafY